MYDEKTLKVEEASKLEAGFRSPLTPILIVGAGMLLLVSNLFHLHLLHWLWPGFIIVPGAILMLPAYNSSEGRVSKLSFLAVPGALIASLGLMLFAMNMTSHYEAWAYSWSLLPGSLVAGFLYANRFSHESGASEAGRKFLRLNVILFGCLAVFFEILIFQSLGPWLPLALIGYGVYLLVKDRRL